MSDNADVKDHRSESQKNTRIEAYILPLTRHYRKQTLYGIRQIYLANVDKQNMDKGRYRSNKKR